jgi:hypothetical protein
MGKRYREKNKNLALILSFDVLKMNEKNICGVYLRPWHNELVTLENIFTLI